MMWTLVFFTLVTRPMAVGAFSDQPACQHARADLIEQFEKAHEAYGVVCVEKLPQDDRSK